MNLTTQRPNNAETAADLWAQLATQLVLIIGANGFDSLFARSVYLCQATYPWLAGRSAHPQTSHRFAALVKSLHAQPPAVAAQANCLLLTTFNNILALMIGERLTTRILDTAWGIDPKGTHKDTHHA